MKKTLLFLFSFGSLPLFSQIIYPGTTTVGSAQVVFDYSVNNCNTIDIPDVPARAFRDANGKINLLASHYTSWRMKGADFNSLVKDCNSVMTSHSDTDPSKFNNNEWISATYTTDGINIHALIHDEYVPCGNWNNCWYNGITYASSVDSGKTYTHSTAPSNLVAASPYKSPYPTTHAPFGIFGGSNIIRKGGYYYKMVQLEAHLLQSAGAGLIRTSNLSDPASWRGWDGSGFNVQFVNPYTATGYNVADKILEPVSYDNIAKMCASLTYNTYFNKYMVVDYTTGVINGATVWGFYYALSDDLINWSSKRLILQTSATWGAGGSNYPSIIDHNDTSRNFEYAGQACYLYYTKWNSGTYDRDLLRIPVTFSKNTVSALVVNSTADTDDKTPGDGLCLTAGNVCTMRAALQEANARPPYDGYDTLVMPITFSISGTGVKTISPNSLFPEIFYPVSINGYTQNGASVNTNKFNQGLNTSITVALDAANSGTALAFHSGNNVVRGLAFLNGTIDFLYEPGYSKSKDNNNISGCFIGIGADGVTPYTTAININNQSANTIGGTTNADRNLIAGGIIISKSENNIVAGNYIGTTRSGIASAGANVNGVEINDSSSYNTIGGNNYADRNLISGGNRGISISGSNNHDNYVIGNYIGVANNGFSALGNSNSGIMLNDSTYSNTIVNNVIADNSQDEAGIWIDSSFSNTIQSNFIGTDSSKTASIGNGIPGNFSAGIMLLNGSANNKIGGSNTFEGNVIANNNSFGISMYSNAGNGNSIMSNLIYNNAEMAIDLAADFTPDPNDNLDSDTGPNTRQNYPVLSGAYATATDITITGSLNSKANSTYTIQYFSNTICNPSGNGEGELLVGTQTITTNASGNATLNKQFNAVTSVGDFITALATDALNNTSEFSVCQIIQSNTVPIITHNTSLTFCQGNSVTLTCSSTNSYLWSNGATAQSIVVTTSGSYSVTVNLSGTPGFSSPTVVTVNSVPAVSITGNISICAGNSTTLTASGADTYVWAGGPSTSVYTVSPTINTTYTVTGTNTSTNCSISESHMVSLEECGTAINENSVFQEIGISPNPTNGIIHISIKNTVPNKLTISVLDVFGKDVLRNLYDGDITSDFYKQINLDYLAKGIYYIKFRIGAEVSIKKICIQ